MGSEVRPSFAYEFIPLGRIKLIDFSVSYANEFITLVKNACNCILSRSFVVNSSDENWNICTCQIGGHLRITPAAYMNGDLKQLLERF